jgi:hypothetical protein
VGNGIRDGDELASAQRISNARLLAL